jgi:hypothetical protein
MAIINQQYLLRPTTTPEQEILINAFFAKFNNGNNYYFGRIIPSVFTHIIINCYRITLQ